MIIRVRTPADLPGCVAVLADTHRRDTYPYRWPDDPTGWLTPTGLLGAWVAELAGVIVGHVALIRSRGQTTTAWTEYTGRPGGDTAEVSRLCVASTARGRSVGRLLLTAAQTGAAELGRHPILGVLDSSPSAISMYDKAGWLRLSTVDFHHSDGTVAIMYCYAAP